MTNSHIVYFDRFAYLRFKTKLFFLMWVEQHSLLRRNEGHEKVKKFNSIYGMVYLLSFSQQPAKYLMFSM